jgi:hypothetical protein
MRIHELLFKIVTYEIVIFLPVLTILAAHAAARSTAELQIYLPPPEVPSNASNSLAAYTYTAAAAWP